MPDGSNVASAMTFAFVPTGGEEATSEMNQNKPPEEALRNARAVIDN